MNKAIDISGVILNTERLTLRPWKESDLEDFFEYASVDGVGQMAGWAPHKSIEESRGILNEFISQKRTLALEHQGKVIGSFAMVPYHEGSLPELAPLQGSEIGFALSKEYWGRGLMPEAVKAMIRYLFETENFDFITAGFFEENSQSARVLEKCGFEYVKTIPYRKRPNTAIAEYILYNPDHNR